MNTKWNRVVLGLALASGITTLGALHHTQPTSAAGLSLAEQGQPAILARKTVCKTYGPEEWALLTGMDSEYGGTMCVS